MNWWEAAPLVESNNWWEEAPLAKPETITPIATPDELVRSSTAAPQARLKAALDVLNRNEKEFLEKFDEEEYRKRWWEQQVGGDIVQSLVPGFRQMHDMLAPTPKTYATASDPMYYAKKAPFVGRGMEAISQAELNKSLEKIGKGEGEEGDYYRVAHSIRRAQKQQDWGLVQKIQDALLSTTQAGVEIAATGGWAAPEAAAGAGLAHGARSMAQVAAVGAALDVPAAAEMATKRMQPSITPQEQGEGFDLTPGMSPAAAVPTALAESFVQKAIEAGGAKVVGGVAGKVIPQALTQAVSNRVKQVMPWVTESRLSKAFQNVTERVRTGSGGWLGGPIEEWGEERLAELAGGAMGTPGQDDFGITGKVITGVPEAISAYRELQKIDTDPDLPDSEAPPQVVAARQSYRAAASKLTEAAQDQLVEAIVIGTFQSPKVLAAALSRSDTVSQNVQQPSLQQEPAEAPAQTPPVPTETGSPPPIQTPATIPTERVNGDRWRKTTSRPEPTESEELPETVEFDTEPMPVPEKAPEPAPEGKAVTFKTSKGSTYTVDPDGGTTRYKVAHEGHDPSDVGPKEKSVRTVYVDADTAREIGMWNTMQNASKKRIVLEGDTLTLTSVRPTATDRGSDGRFKVLSTEPQVGLYPVELWEPDEQGFFRSNHPGNEIVEIGSEASEVPAQEPHFEEGEFRPIDSGEFNSIRPIDSGEYKTPPQPRKGIGAKKEEVPTLSPGVVAEVGETGSVGIVKSIDGDNATLVFDGGETETLPVSGLTVAPENQEAYTEEEKQSVLEGEKRPEMAEAQRGASDTVSQEPAEVRLARVLVEELEKKTPITPEHFFRLADEHFGGSRAEGVYGDSQAYDALELAVNQYLARHAKGADPTVDDLAAKLQAEMIEELSARLPRHKTRTGQKDTLQQFSTPPAYAYVANWVANLRPTDVVLEPSAGTGGLAVYAVNSGAKVYGNEIDPGRAALLRQLPGIEEVFTEDAEHLDGILRGKIVPSVVVMNPPFSRAGHRLGDRKVQGMDLKHIDAALELLAPEGRLVAIVGAGLHGRGKGFDNWMKRLPYNVRADVEVGRDVYKGHGTTFPTRLLVIDKQPRSGSPVTGEVETLSQLIDLLEGVRNERTAVAQQEPAEPSRPRGLGKRRADAEADQPEPSVQPPVSEVGSGQPAAGLPESSVEVPAPAAGERADDAGVGTRGSTGSTPRRGIGAKRADAVEETPEAGDAGSRTGGQPVLEPGESHPSPETGGRVEIGSSKPRRRKELGEAVFEGYETRVQIKGAQKHPASIVESAAMAAIDPPDVTYRPHIPQRVVQGFKADDGTQVGISDVQLEAVATAGQAHTQILPNGERRGFMIGDGTGVGKAREIAGIILDNWNQGRRKAVWISKNKVLYEPAREEWKRVGGDPDKVFSHFKVGSGEAIDAQEGILFTTYSTLKQEASDKAKQKGSAKSRLDQIVDWFGEDFDGVVIFDEAHGMGSAMDRGRGLSRKAASAQALAGVDLQARLPNARVVYLSATSATEVENLAYATRLGLWGEGTPFATREDFVNRISAGGVAAMEKVAADMKAMGMYLARNISFNDGTEKGTVTYDRIEHTLTPDQHAAYDKMSEAWSIVFRNMNAAMELTGANKSGMAVGNARGQFWSANQRFWNQVITAMQTPAVIRSIEADLREGRSAVVQLTNTNEAAQKRALAEREDDEDLDQVDVSPKYILMDYIERSFPTTKYEEYTDDNGNVRSRPVQDSQGNPVRDARALRMKEQLLDELGSLQVANRGALDMIIDHFGEDTVAEVTGRSERLLQKGGKVERQKRSERARKADIEAFMSGRKRVLVFSEAGGTGASYHADLSKKNQQKRHHYLLQAGWRADAAIQGLGRTHRSNQAQTPKYFLVHTNLKGQKRFISTIARRLSQLGALTKGQREAGEAGIFSAADNLESTEAREALVQFYRDAVSGVIEGVDLTYLEDTLGLNIRDSDGNMRTELPPITQFMNRVLSLPVEAQNRVFDEFQRRVDARVEQAVAAGTLDQGMETVKADRIVKESEQVVFTHETGAQAKHVVVSLFRKTKPRTWERVQNSRVKGYVRSKQTGKVFVVEDTGSTEQDTMGRLSRKLKLVGPVDYRYTNERAMKGDNWEELDEAEAEREWREQLRSIPEMHEDKMHLLTGVLLPVWDRLPEKTAQVKRLLTEDGEQILGRVIPPAEVAQTLRKLGASIETPRLTPEQAVREVLRGATLRLANDWTVKRSRVEGETVIEIKGPQFSHNEELERQGVIRRRVHYDTRYFIPTGAEAAAVLEKVTKNRPIAEVIGVEDEALSFTRESDTFVEPRRGPARQTLSTRPVAQSRESIAAADIMKTWERLFDVPLRAGGFSRAAMGIYKVLPEVVRTKESHVANLAVAAHEIAHHVDKQTGMRDAIPDHLRNEVAGLDYEPLGRVSEGWAEYLRHYITEQDAQDIAPEFTRWFEETWLPENPRWARAIREARTHARQYADQSVFQRIRSAIGARPPRDLDWSESKQRELMTGVQRFYRDWKDQFWLFKLIEREAETKGADFSKRASAYELAMAFDKTAPARASSALENGVETVTENRRVLGKGLRESLRLLKGDEEYREAIAYALARHTLAVHSKNPEYNTGIDHSDAEAWMQYVGEDQDKSDRYERFAKGLTQFNNDLLEMLRDAGVITAEDVERMLAEHGETYVPLHRVQDTPKSGMFVGARLVNLPAAVMRRSRKGSGRQVIDPVEATMRRAMYFYGRAMKQQIILELAGEVDPALGGVEGMGGWMDRIEPKTLAHRGTVDEILDTLVEDGIVDEDDARAMRIAARLKYGRPVSHVDRVWFADRHGMEYEPGMDMSEAIDSEPDVFSVISLWRQDYTPSAKKGTVRVVIDGKPVLYEVHRDLYETLAGMDQLTFKGFAAIWTEANKLFKAGAVGVSTGFGVTNLFRDWQTGQFQARHQKGIESVVSPLRWMGHYVADMVRERMGIDERNEAVLLFREAGGEMLTRLGVDQDSMRRTREQLMATTAIEKARVALYHPIQTLKDAAQVTRELVAWSDVAPRLAEFVAVLREHGYDVREGKIINRDTERPARPPRYVIVKAINAAGDITYNYKRIGKKLKYLDAFIPFLNATIEPQDKQVRTLLKLKSLGAKGLDGDQARRLLVASAASAALGWVYWLWRHDDDDYKEQEDWLKRRYWSWGADGNTYVRIGRSREWGFLPTLMEASMSAYYDNVEDALSDAVRGELKDRLPSGGGAARSIVEAFIADYDYHRGRALEPEYTKDDPKGLRYTPYTLELSKAIGYYTGSIGMSPIQVEHVLTNSTGGLYRRWVGTTEKVMQGEPLGPEDIPFARGVLMNRHQAKSIDDFYEEWGQVKERAKWEKSNGSVPPELSARKSLFDEYAALMSAIREIDKRDIRGRRKFLYEKYLVGLAREALGREPLEHNPSPFTDPSVPAELREVLVDHAVEKAEAAILSHGMPTKVHKGDKSFEDTLRKWRASREADEAWIRKYKSSPIIKEALEKVRSGKSYRDLLNRRGRPAFQSSKETWDDHLGEIERWMEKVNRARNWLGDT